MKICFPKFSNQRYYPLHFSHCLALFKELGWPVEEYVDPTGERGCFKMYVDGVEVMVDFSDYGCEYVGPLPTLRFHKKRDQTEPNIYSFPQCSFWDWAEYREFEQQIKYTATGLVMNNQRSANNNVARRDKVRRIVENWSSQFKQPDSQGFGRSANGLPLKCADTAWHNNKRKYWSTLNHCLVSIHVPGQNNNMLDSAQVQLMGFGVCTISPDLPEILPFDKTLVPGMHYVKCANDYSDLVEQIEWCRSHREECMQIGRQAKQLFQETLTPQALSAWLPQAMERVKDGRS